MKRERTKLRLSGGLLMLSLLLRGMRHYGWLAYLLLVLAISAAGYVWGQQIDSNTQKIVHSDVQLKALLASHRRALFGSCQRVNTLRRNQNRAAVQRFQDDMLAARLLASQPRARRAFSARARRIRWVALTDCSSAVDTPEQFKAPLPLPVFGTPLRLIPQ